jgi:hypothetical protein
VHGVPLNHRSKTSNCFFVKVLARLTHTSPLFVNTYRTYNWTVELGSSCPSQTTRTKVLCEEIKRKTRWKEARISKKRTAQFHEMRLLINSLFRTLPSALLCKCGTNRSTRPWITRKLVARLFHCCIKYRPMEWGDRLRTLDWKWLWK